MKESNGVVTLIEDNRHNLEDNDYVTFRNIQGSIELNAISPMSVKVMNPFSFSIGDTSHISPYIDGGEFIQVKQPKIVHFNSLQDSVSKPELVISDFSKVSSYMTVHLGFLAISSFLEREGRLPNPRSESDSKVFLQIAQLVNQKYHFIETLSESDDKLLSNLSFTSTGVLPSMTASIGGLVAQEALKAISGKFCPIKQHFYLECLECIPSNFVLTPSSCSPRGLRYDPQIAIFGNEFFEVLRNLRIFLVGSGAIGCELLKVWSMMGVGTGPNGHIYVTDMDTIEKSNLSRQLLFRNSDIGKLKSITAIEVIKSYNSDFIDHITAFHEKVCPETEHIFDENFFNSLDLVVNALDNVEARRYMDRRCVYFRKPLLESGTLGTKCNTQVIIPNLTESYSSSQDPPEKSIPFCTLKNFPYQTEHTIQWALDSFHGFFHNIPEQVNLYLTSPSFIDHLLKSPNIVSQNEIIEQVSLALLAERPNSFDDCIVWARFKFEELFSNSIQQLLFNFPSNATTSTGTPFWSGPKKCPRPLLFDFTEKDHMNFVVSASMLHAENYHLECPQEVNPQYFKSVLERVVLPPFIPKSGVRIHTNDAEVADHNQGSSTHISDNSITDLLKSIPPANSFGLLKLQVIAFEKDDDSNFHIDFITSAANLRAINYNITPTDRHKAKGIAGKIIPAIATTTAFVAGLICIEMTKVVEKNRKIEEFKNSFANLALPLFAFSEPLAAPKNKYNGIDWTLWDRFDISGDLTLREMIEYFQRQYSLEVTMASFGRSVLFGFIRQKDELAKRMSMPLRELIPYVTKQNLPSHLKSLVIEILACDNDGEDVEVPYIAVSL